jgi:hypothetical protein
MRETVKTVVPIRDTPDQPAHRAHAGAYAREETVTTTAQTVTTAGDETRPLLVRILADLALPEPLTARPATPGEVLRYARHGDWTAPDQPPHRPDGEETRPLSRRLGRAYAVVPCAATVVLGGLTWAIAPKLPPVDQSPQTASETSAIARWTPPHWSALTPPAPAEVWRHARSAPSLAVRVYGYAAATWTTVTAYTLWLLARPSRAAVAAAIAGLWLLL